MDINEYIKSGIIESYVLGLADTQEVAELENLRLSFPEINEAIAQFEEELENNAMKNAVPVTSTAIKDTIFKNLQIEKPTLSSRPLKEKSGNVVSISKFLAVAASFILIASVAYNIYAFTKMGSLIKENKDLAMERTALFAKNSAIQTKAEELNTNVQLLADPQIMKIALNGLKDSSQTKAIVLWSKINHEVRFMAKDLPALPSDKQYQLWALVDGKPLDAGVIGDCSTSICKLKDIAKAQAFAITVEKAGGSPTPTLSQLQAMGKMPG